VRRRLELRMGRPRAFGRISWCSPSGIAGASGRLRLCLPTNGGQSSRQTRATSSARCLACLR
jgi:hypothetical protein